MENKTVLTDLEMAGQGNWLWMAHAGEVGSEMKLDFQT